MVISDANHSPTLDEPTTTVVSVHPEMPIMTHVRIILNIFVFSVILNGYDCHDGYYWREYLGRIPQDAIVAGKDIQGNNIYIGQAYIKDCGLVVVEVKQGTKEVIAPIGGPKKTDKYIKVLCGSPGSFDWIKANASTFQTDVAGETPVIGGQEDSYGYMNIGRVYYESETKVGKVNGFWPESATMYFIDRAGNEKLLQTYEVLVYKDDVDAKINQLFAG